MRGMNSSDKVLRLWGLRITCEFLLNLLKYKNFKFYTGHLINSLVLVVEMLIFEMKKGSFFSSTSFDQRTIRVRTFRIDEFLLKLCSKSNNIFEG